ncbi:LysE family transporter [Halobacillus sp. ACCC02827]|uniref:LysE family transporter n=1 Tax=Bacillaceae TaxID=186817 RepID=UPI0002A518B4|nr:MULTISPECIES: LysE family transporter [Bacillaceae]ELK48011.1 lysine exporter protein LysE/YggA [Halobacillus sp. BAB-2008]QHT47580.1 LysE family transporter [Bacillus sp. SB49]WJE14811.1 LysE family transporter [Halobacillus sp. ACCC02827]
MFFSYILLGISLSAPLGPINAAQLDKGVRYGFLHAWLVGIGAMAADALFMLLIYLGLAQYVDFPLVKSFLWSFGAFVLLYTGVESIHSSGGWNEEEHISGSSKRKSFRTGFLMALTNPLNILFWMGIYGSILAEVSSRYDDAEILLYSGGIFLGIMLWDILMALAASGARRLLTGRLLRGVSITSGIMLMGFGVYFGFQAYRMIFG